MTEDQAGEIIHLLKEILAGISRMAPGVSGPSTGRSFQGGAQPRRESPPDSTTPDGPWKSFILRMGAHRGKSMGMTPQSYLEWMVTKCWEWKYKDLRDAVKNYAELRGLRLPPNPEDEPAPPTPPESRGYEVPRDSAIAPNPRPLPQNSNSIDDDVPF